MIVGSGGLVLMHEDLVKRGTHQDGERITFRLCTHLHILSFSFLRGYSSCARCIIAIHTCMNISNEANMRIFFCFTKARSRP